jgi:hypothetical protein
MTKEWNYRINQLNLNGWNFKTYDGVRVYEHKSLGSEYVEDLKQMTDEEFMDVIRKGNVK